MKPAISGTMLDNPKSFIFGSDFEDYWCVWNMVGACKWNQENGVQRSEFITIITRSLVQPKGSTGDKYKDASKDGYKLSKKPKGGSKYTTGGG